MRTLYGLWRSTDSVQSTIDLAGSINYQPAIVRVRSARYRIPGICRNPAMNSMRCQPNAFRHWRREWPSRHRSMGLCFEGAWAHNVNRNCLDSRVQHRSREIRCAYLFASLKNGSPGQLHLGFANAQTPNGSDTNPRTNDRYMFGDWAGERTKVANSGVVLNVFYVNDLFGDGKGDLGNWSRLRGTLDVDFGKAELVRGLKFHMAAMWQAGGNLAAYLGTIANPSSNASSISRAWIPGGSNRPWPMIKSSCA